jgi:hypothetical protein
MKNIQTSTLSNKEFSFNVLNSIQVEVHVEKNDYNLPLDDLFMMAARINKKRSFLFVSKVLGKHFPINPNKGLLTSALLAARYYEVVKGGECASKNHWVSSFLLNEPSFTRSAFIPKIIHPLIIGFAETATALGHAFFDCFESADYVHTTREVLDGQHPVITFEEEHSHATSHRCYMPLDMIENNREIILVDDELTTGKTALNIIRSIHARFPRNEYTIVSILDWRSVENRQQFKQLEKSLGITIHVVSLIAGKVQVTEQKEIAEQSEINHGFPDRSANIEAIYLPALFEVVDFPSVLSNGRVNHTPFLLETGRFGINSDLNRQNQQKITEAASFLKRKRSGRKTLCLGTGEFMYLPMKIAAEMGPSISYQSTTRSPIFIQNVPNYGAGYGVAFPNPEDMDIAHFVYNIPPGNYDEIYLFFEREVDRENLLPMLKELEKTHIKSIKLVYFLAKLG